MVLCVNADTRVGFQRSVQQKRSPLRCVQIVLCGSWSGRETHSSSCFVAPEAIDVEGLSGGTYFPGPGKPQGCSSSEISCVRGLALPVHKESAANWKSWAKHVCRFACITQAVVLAESCGETVLFAGRGSKFFHQDCCSTFLKCSRTLLGFWWCDPYKDVILYSPNWWRWAGRVLKCMAAL